VNYIRVQKFIRLPNPQHVNRYSFLIWIFVLLFSIPQSQVIAQRIYGNVTDAAGNILPFSTITIKDNPKFGALANNIADYSISVSPGMYTLICQRVGYEKQEKKVTITDQDIKVDFLLQLQKLMLEEVVISSSGENPAYRVIRNAIKKRPEYLKQVSVFSCGLYSKDLIKLRNLPNKIMGQKIDSSDKKNMGLDSSGNGIIYLSEAFSNVTSAPPDKLKMEVKQSRVSGSNSFGFAFPAFINFYENNIDLFKGGVNARGFISPVADGALRYYKYRMMGTYTENGNTIYTIKVTPKRSFEPLFTGIINITDNDWRIHSLDMMVTKNAQLELMDTIKLSQLHAPSNENVWSVKNQTIYFNIRFFGIDAVGHNVSVFSDYEINPKLEKKYFDNVVIRYDTAVAKKPKKFWDENRPLPLTEEEKMDYVRKDSLFKIRQDSFEVNNRIDTLKKRQGKVRWKNIFHAGVSHTHYSKTNTYRWGINPLLFGTGYNTVEGLYTDLSGSVTKTLKTKNVLNITPHVRYGFSNERWNSWVEVQLTGDIIKNKMNAGRWKWDIEAGKKLVQFNEQEPVAPLTNAFTTLFYGDNPMKVYEKITFHIGYKRNWENGFKLRLKADFNDRIPLQNTTNFSFVKNNKKSFTENWAISKNADTGFNRHQALVAGVEISMNPGQKYIQYPDRKASMGSDYPTFTARYMKGINHVAGSDVDFDRWELEVSDDANLKILGTFKYKFLAGGFLNREKVFIQDMKHFLSNGIRATTAYMNGFQLMDSYINSNASDFYSEAHIEHHFNGLLTNKIPYFKKWNWYLVAGGNAYYVNKNDNYHEFFVGLENIFKIFRLDFVSAFQNGKPARSSVVLGLGGMLGGSMSGGGGNSISIGF
jgi:hypothetical protein